MKAYLQVISGARQGVEIAVKGPQFLIGRDPKCQLRPNSDLVSKVHCVFEVTPTAVTLTDQGSTNGTFVNGHRISETVTLKPEDEIQVGGLVFRVRLEVPSPKATGPEGAEDDVLDFLMDGEPVAPSASTLFDFSGQAQADTDTRVDPHPLPPADSPTIVSTDAKGETSDAPAAPSEPKKGAQDAAGDILKRLLQRPRN